MNIDTAMGTLASGDSSSSQKFREVVERIDAVMHRFAAFSGYRAECRKYLGLRDGSWEELFRAIKTMELTADRLEANAPPPPGREGTAS